MPTRTKKSTSFIEEPPVTDNEETITFKRTHFYTALVVLAFGVGLMLGYVLWGSRAAIVVAQEPAPAAQPSAPQNQPTGPLVEAPTAVPETIRYNIPTEGFPSLGPDDAPITIVEFSDYQCPFCRRFHQQTFQALLDAYPGQIRFIYRNLPVTAGEEPTNSALAALCANDQDVFWEYHDKLFTNDALNRNTYLQHAEELELDMDEFTACYDERKHMDAITADMQYAANIGVRSTPTFFINGLAFVGAQPLPNFQQLIDSELAGEIP
jgi:protein-disulfide isomerase